MRKLMSVLLLAMLTSTIVAQQGVERRSWHKRIGAIVQDPNVHDPVMMKQDSTYYLFFTGMLLPVMSSTDMKNWKFERNVFDVPPRWAMEAVVGYRGHTWAPDIVEYNGKYHLYYSCSTFGKNTSAIGHAERTTLSATDTLARWEDTGMVVASKEGENNYNAIDPSVIVDEKGRAWMAFGSFWGGIQLIRLTPDMAHRDSSYQQHTIARRSQGKAIEAPFLYRHGAYYYLFVSWDYCCRGEKSDYKVVVGRSPQVEGPYLDRTGKHMLKGGGTLVYDQDERMIAGGHNSVYTIDGEDYFICHGYTREHGESKLILKKITWDDGWPILR